MKCIVVYYSLSGATAKAARAIADALKCDMEVITEPKKRKGFVGFIRSGYESATKKVAPIHEAKKSPAGYDLVILGCPVWAGTMASPMRTYLTKHGALIRNAAFFSTAGSEKGMSFVTMESLLGKKPVATVSFTTKQIKNPELFNGEAMRRIDGFSAAVKTWIGTQTAKPAAAGVRAAGARAARTGSGGAAKKTASKRGAQGKAGPRKPGPKPRKPRS